MGYTLYKFDMTMQGPAGQTIHDVGKDMAVWKKESDGKWKIVADTFNSDLPPPPSPGK
jgi:ketosteroid isomerase-like protein